VLLLQQSMCVQCLLLLLQSCESQLLLLLLSLCLCLCLSHRRNDTSHAAAFVSVDVDSSCDEREEIYIDRQTDTVLAVAYRLLYSIAKARGTYVCMYQPWRRKETRLIFFDHLQPKWVSTISRQMLLDDAYWCRRLRRLTEDFVVVCQIL
jgi:hypothetical protein